MQPQTNTQRLVNPVQVPATPQPAPAAHTPETHEMPLHDLKSPSSIRDLELGKHITFVIAPWRSGSTLLRKILDSHPNLYAPSETWFMLPLMNVWDGKGEHPSYNPLQAATALQQHLRPEHFVECVRAFAGRFYATGFSPGITNFIDKTPMYLPIAPMLAAIFPHARFICLARDPRGIAWSRHTWKHIQSADVSGHYNPAANDLHQLATFYAAHRQRSALVRYEDLCNTPAETARSLCAFLDVPEHAGMVNYGSSPHHEGYGCERTREHANPHAESTDRFARQGAMTAEQQRACIAACDAGVLDLLGYARLLGAAQSAA